MVIIGTDNDMPAPTALAGGGWSLDISRAIERHCVAVALLWLALLVPAAVPSSAGADVGSKIIERCMHEQSLSGFAPQDYRKALHELTTEGSEYSDCEELIQAAQRAAAGGGFTGSGPSGSGDVRMPASPNEQRAIEKAHRAGASPVRVGTQLILPGVVHANAASGIRTLPAPLIALLVLVCASSLTAAGVASRKRRR